LLCLRSDTRHYGHINRCSYLLTYLLTNIHGLHIYAKFEIRTAFFLELVTAYC